MTPNLIFQYNNKYREAELKMQAKEDAEVGPAKPWRREKDWFKDVVKEDVFLDVKLVAWEKRAILKLKQQQWWL